MPDTRLILAAFWTALMLSYLLGDVLRIFSGDFKAGEIAGKKVSQNMWLGIAVMMVLPIVMIVLTMVLTKSIGRWLNLITAAFFFLFNIIGLPTYPSKFDKFLNVVGLLINGVTIWYAWGWV